MKDKKIYNLTPKNNKGKLSSSVSENLMDDK